MFCSIGTDSAMEVKEEPGVGARIQSPEYDSDSDTGHFLELADSDSSEVEDSPESADNDTSEVEHLLESAGNYTSEVEDSPESADNDTSESPQSQCFDRQTSSSYGCVNTCIKSEDDHIETLLEGDNLSCGQVYDIHGESQSDRFPQATVKLEADQSDDYDGYGGDTRRWICDDGELKEIVKVETVDEKAETFQSRDYADRTDPDDIRRAMDKAEEDDIVKSCAGFKCRTCDRSFQHANSCQIHERSHTGERPYVCSTCGKTFTQSRTLKGHERIHTGVRPYSCDTCHSSFVDSCDLKKHELIHTGAKSYACSTC